MNVDRIVGWDDGAYVGRLCGENLESDVCDKVFTRVELYVGCKIVPIEM